MTFNWKYILFAYLLILISWHWL